MTTAFSLDAALARGETIQVDPILLTQLEAVVGKRNVATSIADLICYSHDIMPPAFKWVRRDDLPYLPHMVVFPGSTRTSRRSSRSPTTTASRSSRLAARRARSAASCRSSGGIIIDMKRMNRFIDLDPYSLTVDGPDGHAGPGLRRPAEHARLHRRPLPAVDPLLDRRRLDRARVASAPSRASTERSRTSSNRWKSCWPTVRWRAPRTTRVLRAGRTWTKLFIGSEGTLGIITEATLRIWPTPAKRTWIGYGMPTFEAGVRACRDILADGPIPGRDAPVRRGRDSPTRTRTLATTSSSARRAACTSAAKVVRTWSTWKPKSSTRPARRWAVSSDRAWVSAGGASASTRPTSRRPTCCPTASAMRSSVLPLTRT